MLSYGLTIAIIWTVFLGILFVLTLFVFILGPTADETGCLISGLMLIVLVGFCLCLNIGQIIEIKTAPKLYVLEQLRHELK